MATLQPVIIDVEQTLHPQATINEDHRSNFKALGITSILNVILGLLALSCGIALLAKGNEKRNWVNDTSMGILLGAWVTCAGIFGIIAWKTKKTSWVATSMAFNIVSSVITAVGIIFSSIAVSYYRKYATKYRYDCDNYYPNFYVNYSCLEELRVTGSRFTAMYSLLLSFSLASFVISIILATFASRVACTSRCCCPSTTPKVSFRTQNQHPTYTPVASSGPIYFVQGIPNAVQNSTYYPQQILNSNTFPTAPAPTAIYAAGVQPSLLQPSVWQPVAVQPSVVKPSVMQPSVTIITPPRSLSQEEGNDRPPPYTD